MRSIRLALLVILLAVPSVVSAAAPFGLRTLVAGQPMATAELAQHPALNERSTPATAPPSRVIAAEVLTDPHGLVERPAQPPQAARIVDLPRPHDPSWIARRLQVPALGIDVAVAMAGGAAHEDFPPSDGAYILRSSSQPGRGTNTYLFAHAVPHLFKPLWWAEVGQQVIVTMSDGQQLAYRVTAVVRNIPCPDPSAPKPAGLPPVLANATECDASWTFATPTERLTMQTSQGFNRNYGEMVVIAEPDG
ncbi:MAG: sortase [Chloroflexi bacterium]|nr:sortase [Chloroflexota bacterium]